MVACTYKKVLISTWPSWEDLDPGGWAAGVLAWRCVALRCVALCSVAMHLRYRRTITMHATFTLLDGINTRWSKFDG